MTARPRPKVLRDHCRVERPVSVAQADFAVIEAYAYLTGWSAADWMMIAVGNFAAEHERDPDVLKLIRLREDHQTKKASQ